MDGSWDRGREIKVLCPGAGLGRLMWEIARLGIQRRARSLLDGHEVLTVLDGLPRVYRLHVPRQRVLVLYAARWQLCIEPVRAGGWRVLEHCSRDASVSLHTARAVDSLTELNQYTFYPAVTTSSNVVNTLDQLKYESAFRGVRATICELELTYPSVHITERTRYRTCCRATSRAPPDSPCVPATLSRSIGISQPSGTVS